MEEVDSPPWKKPSDIMKRRRILPKASLKNKIVNNSSKNVKNEQQCFSSQNVVKRKNPFKNSPSKVPNISENKPLCNLSSSKISNISGNEQSCNSPVPLFKALSSIEQFSTQHQKTCEKSSESLSTQVEQYTELLPKSLSKHCSETNVPTKTAKPDFPIDWSLKMRLRFTSPESFKWAASFKTIEESNGIFNFLQNSCDPQIQSEPNLQERLQKETLVWKYPHFPWLKLFPRILANEKIGKQPIFTQDSDVQNILFSDWSKSFSSVFNTLRADRCPYFYLCSHHFTVLFRAGGFCPDGVINALVTPTSRGFRESLKNEGINFKMPLKNDTLNMGSTSFTGGDITSENISEPDVCTPAADKNDEITDEIENADDGASTWLESIGLDKKQFPSLNPNRVKLQRDFYKLIDNRPESTIYTEGSDTQALFNYLLNYRSLVPVAGIHAGIPPTILSPTTFKGATLEPLKINQTSVKQQSTEGSISHIHILDISGPILPSNISGISYLLTETQKQYVCHYSICEPTTPFNSVSPKSEFQNHLADQFGISEKHIKQILTGNNLEKNALRELVCNNGLFQ